MNHYTHFTLYQLSCLGLDSNTLQNSGRLNPVYVLCNSKSYYKNKISHIDMGWLMC